MQEQIDRVEPWAKTLIDGQAPHQQQLAQDVMVLVNHAKGSVQGPSDAPFSPLPAEADTPTLKTAYAQLEDDYDQLVTRVDDLEKQLEIARSTIEKMIDDNAKVVAERDGLQSLLDSSTAPTGPVDMATAAGLTELHDDEHK